MNTNNRQRINIAVTAMGGQGGGVLADWIVGMAESTGWIAQTTSVPGVAQRTGATIYYLELFQPSGGQADAPTPILSLSPAGGDVDLVIAAELMEAGRAIQRGFVTPDRTTLIASSHRAYAVSEKESMGYALADPEVIHQAAGEMSQRYICFDMEAQAKASGSVISAVLFGALCGSGALPFAREVFEQAIRNGGVGVEASLRAFAAGHDQARHGDGCTDSPEPVPTVQKWTYQGADQGIHQLLARVETDFPDGLVTPMTEGIRRLLDHTGLRYAELYVERMQQILALEQGLDADKTLSHRVAARLAVWMAYEDTIRVAEIKTRARRFDGLYQEVGIQHQQVSYFREYLHPRIEEVAETLPASLGRWVLGNRWASALMNRLFAGPKVVSTQSLRGFLSLYLVARMRRWRHRTLRYTLEQERIDGWLALLTATVRVDHELSCEVAKLPELIKGYGRTHARGLKNFGLLCRAAEHLQGQPDAAAVLVKLHQAALKSESGTELAAALRAAGLENLAKELGSSGGSAGVVQVMEPQPAV
ncbi:indolepyruvate ferredoxin oxidoreductase beta subunit [Marinobacterium halophilum]|uniref:Indolepyruvate ferredoxin oxidoreductase beta subunit n=1 Tax=Marinobacterium halophilum TaxID=267374 RepID=A0A2P8ERV5_9GAMM|nr:indolepyruvate oxidoreductase subunit beta family protein [Marinobacterium halophilum]PSL12221.1 indolepyruvate ferredoxin oxidoreductase beta subunit [Marinobacterium halophilum]